MHATVISLAALALTMIGCKDNAVEAKLAAAEAAAAASEAKATSCEAQRVSLESTVAAQDRRIADLERAAKAADPTPSNPPKRTAPAMDPAVLGF